MSRKLTRYQQPEIVNHLASNYVLGTLSSKVRQRVDTLRRSADYQLLDTQIVYWETNMSPLNEKIPALTPKTETWQKIQVDLNLASAKQAKPNGLSEWFNAKFFQLATFCSLCVVAVLSYTYVNQPENIGPLSYVAVLADNNQQAQLVAATYGESKTLLLDIVTLPELQQGETFELWVKSKTDFQVRSLGEVPIDVDSYSRELSEAEWRLIKDSDSLLISIEETGGSPIGEPMGDIISSGACVRLSAWQEQV